MNNGTVEHSTLNKSSCSVCVFVHGMFSPFNSTSVLEYGLEPELKPKLWFKCISSIPLCRTDYVTDYITYILATETQYCDKSKSMTFSCRSHLKLFDNLRAPAYNFVRSVIRIYTRINKTNCKREM